jgi:hypothetical protein
LPSNIQIQKTGASVAFAIQYSLPASDLERWKESKLAKLAADQALCLNNGKATMIKLMQFSKSIT